MKKIYLIGGAMGVGKTTVAQILKTKLSNSVFLDGDWCWDSDPFQVTEETKIMVIDNISHLLNNFIHCSASAVYLKLGCLVMSYLSERNGRTPRNCKMHLPPSITASSSWLISSFPNF